MRLWMHGIGKDIPASVLRLKTLGFEAVVGNDPLLIREANAAGLDVYLCCGAFGASGKFSAEQYLARDINGKPQPWFNSTCPNQPEVRQANLESIAAMAQTPGIKGILIDGARFASPASSPDPDAFYTCFCPTCEQKAEALGFDFSSMKNAVASLYQHVNGVSTPALLDHAKGILDWFAFRRQCTTEHLLNFCKLVKRQDPNLLTGIYIFSPALSFLVGQSYEDLSEKMDIFAPMIYRHYTANEGPACLNHELSVLVKELSKALFSPQNAISLIASLSKLPLGGFDSCEDIFNGLPPAAIGSETRQAISRLAKSSQIIPILQLDDDHLEQSIQETLQAGALGVNFFVYQEEWLDQAQPIFERFLSK